MPNTNQKIQKGFLTVQDASNNGTPVPFFPFVRQKDVIPPNTPRGFESCTYKITNFIEKFKVFDDAGSSIYYRRFTDNTAEVTIKIPLILDTNVYRVPSEFASLSMKDLFTSPAEYKKKFKNEGVFFGHNPGRTQPITSELYKDPSCTVSTTIDQTSTEIYIWRPYLYNYGTGDTQLLSSQAANNHEYGWWKRTNGTEYEHYETLSSLVSYNSFNINDFKITAAHDMSARIIGKGPLAPVLRTARITPSLVKSNNNNSYYDVLFFTVSADSEYTDIGTIYLEPFFEIDRIKLNYPDYVYPTGVTPSNEIPGLYNKSVYIELTAVLEVE